VFFYLVIHNGLGCGASGFRASAKFSVTKNPGWIGGFFFAVVRAGSFESVRKRVSLEGDSTLPPILHQVVNILLTRF